MSQSDSRHSSVPGGDMNTTDLPNENFENDARSDDIFAAQDEHVTILEDNIFQRVIWIKFLVLHLKVKYGLDQYVGYSKLNSEKYCFVTPLNKNYKPKTLFEASKYSHWADAMNDEMDALLRNDT
uniref:Ribonuclease H-like domain-containing protein n=1 Tax=Tanacetum cinerariifolium TaxID=118510 RepID=A0A699HW54_TANCI|nr:ribonuclease H-like domain-containing protein [Tanacetum cinerariifolium]